MNYLLDKETYELDFSSQNEELIFNVLDNKEVSLTLLNIEGVPSIHFEISDNAILRLAIFAQNPVNSQKITANLGENSQIITYYADFSVDKNKLDASINLNKRNVFIIILL